MPESGHSINLVKNKQIPFIDKFMNWALTIGRLIVIITEVVAVIAFIYRFSLDEKLVELHSAIKQKQVLISLLRNDENKYRNLQTRLALASNSSEKIGRTNRILKDIIDLIPQGAKINDLTFNKDRINIDVNITSISSLTGLINSLKNYPEIKSINVDSIESKPSIGLLVSVIAMLK